MKLYVHYQMTSHNHVTKNGKAVRTRPQSETRRLRARLNNTVEGNRKDALLTEPLRKNPANWNAAVREFLPEATEADCEQVKLKACSVTSSPAEMLLELHGYMRALGIERREND